MPATSAAPTCCQFRQRESFLSPLWRIVSDHLDNFLRNYEERYESTHGRLAPYVEKVLNQFLLCGDPNQGLTLFTCKKCNISLAVPFSCKKRICPSCMSRRAEDLSEGLGDALPRVPYRHVVVTLPRLMGIRHRIRETPALMRRVTRLAVGVLSRYLVRQVHDSSQQARPGFVVAWQTFGDNLTYHPHLHILVTDGVFLPDDNFHGYLEWDPTQLTCLLRQSIVTSFSKLGLLSPEAAETMLSWPVGRSGFNVHVDTSVDENDRDQLKTLLRYLTRPPITMDRLHYIESSGQVRYRTRKGAELCYLHAVDFLADLTQHIPPPRRQTISYHGHFANAFGSLEGRREPEKASSSESPPSPRRAAWARLVLRVWQVDPELCPRCGSKMHRSRALVERHELVRLLKNLAIGSYPVRPPPAAVPETAPVTYGAVGRRTRPTPPERTPSDAQPSEPDEVSQIPADWDDWPAAG